jgi:hypothetical protein
MSEKMIMVPVRAQFCIDLVRFSDGRITLDDIGALAEEQILSLLEGLFDEFGPKWFARREEEFADIYFPHIAEQVRKAAAKGASKYAGGNSPLIWKGLMIPHETDVRMNYAGRDHFAVVRDGMIADEDGAFSPSEWARKVAAGTSRNAWRDLWFKMPPGRKWVPAQLLREELNAGDADG